MLGLLFASLLMVPGLVLAADPIVGTWKMNVAKSKFNPGPAPKSSTATYAEDGDWLVLKVDGVSADGKPVTRNSRFKLDGKEYPYDSPYGKGMIAGKKTGERRGMATVTLNSGGSYTQQTVISADGKTRTITTNGKNAQGQAMNNTVVYERQ